MPGGFGMEVSYSDAPVRDAVVRLKTFGGERAHAMWDAIGAANVSSTQIRFRTGTDPDGAPWKPSKRVLKKGGQTLVLSRRLEDSVTHNVLPGNDGVEWGTNERYGAVDQFGADITIYARSQDTYRKVNKKGELSAQFVKKAKANFAQHVTLPEYQIHIPARPYIGFNAADRAEAEDIAAAHVEAMALGTTVASVRAAS